MLYGEIILKLLKQNDIGREQIILLAAVIADDVKSGQELGGKEIFNYFLMSIAYAIVYSEKENAEFLYHVARTMLSEASNKVMPE